MAWSDHYVTDSGSDTYANSTNSSTPCSLAEAVTNVAAGDRVNVKAGTYTIAADLAFANAGTTTAPIWWRGYKTTPGDLDAAGGSRIPATDLPRIVTTNVTDQVVSAGAHQIWSNIAVASTCTDTGGAWNSTGGNQRFIRCQMANTQANTASRAFTCATAGPVVLWGCRFSATTTATTTIQISITSLVFGCRITGGAAGVSYSGIPLTISNCIIDGFATTGVVSNSASNGSIIDHCTIYSVATNGILISALPTVGLIIITNTIIGGCTNGVNNNVGTNTNGVTLGAVHFYACTNNIVGLAEQADVTADLTAALFCIDGDTDPFFAKASADFTLISTAVDKSAAYPGVFDDPSGTNVMIGYPDIGALRHIDPTAAAERITPVQRNLPDIRLS